MATIESYETSGGKRYQVRYRTPEHKQTKKRGFRTKRDAEQFAASVEVQKYRGEYVSHQAGQATVGELGPGWLVRQSAHLKPSSLLALEIGWRVHVEPRWRDVRVSDISRTTIQDWVAALGADRSATTVKRAFGVLSSILDDAVDDRRITANPAKGVKTKRKVMRGRVYLNHKQVDRLAREAGDAAGVVLVLAYTGIRWGEMIALRVRDVDTTRRRLAIERNAVEVGTEIHIGTPKNHERRSVPTFRCSTRSSRRPAPASHRTRCSSPDPTASSGDAPGPTARPADGSPVRFAEPASPGSLPTTSATPQLHWRSHPARTPRPFNACSATSPPP